MVASGLFLLASLALTAAAQAPAGAHAVQQEYSIVEGTVFREDGFALAGADVSIEMLAPENANEPKHKAKVKKLTATSSARGEFSFRVIPYARKYRVKVTAKGFNPGEKIVEVEGAGERAEATFNLSPESKR
ncbi:MAG TPA: carboxypeptidase-like regulatory domain-containing protein [Bryobacteraceae bacterium]